MSASMSCGPRVIGWTEGGGARMGGGVIGWGGYGEFFSQTAPAPGAPPQISAPLAPGAGGGVYTPAMTDFIIMAKGTSNMFITGPEVIKAVTGEDVSFEELGGATAHASKSGVAHFAASDERAALRLIRNVLSYLPSNNVDDPPIVASDDEPNRMDPELSGVVPKEPDKPYDMRDVIGRVVDRDSWLEVHADWAQNIVVGFARLEGRPIGVVGNQPKGLAGTLGIKSSTKAARFVRFCDCFNIPLLTFVDVPGFLPGVEQEYGGGIRHGGERLFSLRRATVPQG